MCEECKSEVQVFKALSDENRLAVLQLLCTGEKCACRLLDTLHIGQSTLSHHMKILCDAGLVKARKDGKWTYYSIDKTSCDAAATFLQACTQAESGARDAC